MNGDTDGTVKLTITTPIRSDLGNIITVGIELLNAAITAVSNINISA